MIIGFCGNLHAGKDTAGAYLIKKYGFERRAFADPVKKSIAALFDIPYWEVDKFKNDPEVRVTVDVYDGDDVGEIFATFTFRQFIQRYGTEAHRDIPEIGYNFWVDLTLPVGGYYAGRKIVITDCRFTNEVERIQMLDGFVIRIIREGMEVPITEHISEQSQFLNANFTIENNGTIEDLYEQLDNLLATIPDRMLDNA